MSAADLYSGDAVLDAHDSPAESQRDRFAHIERGSALASALMCLALGYLLSWTELALNAITGAALAHSFAASAAALVLTGLLYACVAGNLHWARWLTIALGAASVALVAPTLALQWTAFPAVAIVSGIALVCKLSASMFLLASTCADPRRIA